MYEKGIIERYENSEYQREAGFLLRNAARSTRLLPHVIVQDAYLRAAYLWRISKEHVSAASEPGR